jgi:hypothetical protein
MIQSRYAAVMRYAVKLSMLISIVALFAFHFSQGNQPGRCNASRQHTKDYTIGAVDESGHAYPIKGFNPQGKNWKLVFSLSDGRTVEGEDRFLLNLIKLIKFRCVDGGASTPDASFKIVNNGVNIYWGGIFINKGIQDGQYGLLEPVGFHWLFFIVAMEVYPELFF